MQATDLARIADIIPPEMPSAPVSFTPILLFAVALVLMFIGGMLYRRTLHAQLTRLRRCHRRHRTANRDIALQLRDLIRTRWPGKHTFTDNESDQQWKNFSRQLQQACFSRTPPDETVIQTLFEQSRYWLMRSP